MNLNVGTSLKDIATALNLSTTTVSWVLSGKGDEKNISKKTQLIVIRCSKEMGYQPNLMARSLNLGISNTIGLILPSISDSFYSQIAEEIELEAKKFGYTLMICNSESEIEQETKMIQMQRAKQVDGIIIAPTTLSTRSIQEMIDDNFPFVLFDRYFAEMATNYVIIDNEACSYKLVKHLIEKGSKKIALITTNPHLLILQHRYSGYCRAHAQSGLPIDPNLNGVVEFANYKQNIVNIFDEIFEKVPDVDGFFFISHILAIEGLVYMYEHGIDVNKFELGCIHETTSFRVLAPKMHTAVMPVKAIAQEAVNILIQEIINKDNRISYKRSTTLSTTIHFRD